MHTPEEAAHKISIQLTPAYAEHLDHKINFLDTPVTSILRVRRWQPPGSPMRQ